MANQQPRSKLDYHLRVVMCQEAADGFEMQCAREYWSEDNEKRRATAIHQLSASARDNLPTNNLNTERYLARFGGLASDSARHSNKSFKGKRIRDDVMFGKTETQIANNTKSIQGIYINFLMEWRQYGLNLKKICSEIKLQNHLRKKDVQMSL
jgi:hypothetical protein